MKYRKNENPGRIYIYIYTHDVADYAAQIPMAQGKHFQVKSNSFLGLPRNLAFMTISASHPCCIDYGTFLVRFLWACCDKLQRVQIGMPSSGWHDHSGALHQHIGREVVAVWD